MILLVNMAEQRPLRQCDSEWCDYDVTLSNHWEVHDLCIEQEAPSPVHNAPATDFVRFHLRFHALNHHLAQCDKSVVSRGQVGLT